MAQIYGHRWTAPHGESPDAESSSAGTWAKGLAGITPRQLGAGLEACIVRADPWPPTLPEFRALCLGIPSIAEVRRELIAVDEPRSGFTVLVWSRLDWFAFRRAEGRAAERMLQSAYDEARERVMRGEPVPAPYVPLPPPEARPAVPARPEVARAAIAEIAMLFPPEATDPVAEFEPPVTRVDQISGQEGVDTSE